MARHAGLLRQDGDLGEILDDDAEEDVVRDLADARELAFTDVSDAGSRNRRQIRLDLFEGGLRTRNNRRELAGFDALAVAAHRRADEFAAQLLQPRADRLGLFDADRGAVDQDLRPRPGGVGDEPVGPK